MELLYIWIEDYKNIYRQGFNFSPKYKFEFDFDKNELTHKKIESTLPENFFGDNIVNVTGIVGKNGVGKTTLIKAINYAFEFLSIGKDGRGLIFKDLDYAEYLKKKSVFILVFENDKKLGGYIIHFNGFKFDVKGKDFEINPIIKSFYIENDTTNINLEENKNYGVPNKIEYSQIFYANNFENKKLLTENVTDISNVGLIYERGTDIDKYQKLFQDDFKRQVIFLDKNPNEVVQKISEMQFNIPEKFNVNISTGFDRRYTVGKFILDNFKDKISLKQMLLFGVYNYIRTITNKRALKNKYFYTDEVEGLYENSFTKGEQNFTDFCKENIKNIGDEELKKVFRFITLDNIESKNEYSDKEIKELFNLDKQDIILEKFLQKIKKEEDILNDIKFLENLFYFNGLVKLKNSKNFENEDFKGFKTYLLEYINSYLKEDSSSSYDNYGQVTKSVKEEIDKLKEEINKNKTQEKQLELLEEFIEFHEYYNFTAIKDFINNIDKYVKFIIGAKGGDDKIEISKLFETNIELNFKDKDEKETKTKIAFIKSINNAFSNPAGVFIRLNWQGLSSGEIAMLNVFSRLFSVVYDKENDKEKQENVKNNILLTIDEGELYLHPEWQRRYFELIQKTVPLIFSDIKNKVFKNIQIIISSHSPFIISDIPKQNIIFLERDNDEYCRVVNELDMKQTFGANIHTLFTSSFFMEGLMGNFAKEKMDKAIKYLNESELKKEEITYCEQIISIIGEPIIKNQLQRMLNDKRLKKLDKIDEIDQLRKRIEILENK